MESKEHSQTSKQRKLTQTHRHRQKIGSCGAGGVGGLGEKGEGIRKYKLVVTHGPRDVQYSRGHRVNNIGITVCGARGYWDIEGTTL